MRFASEACGPCEAGKPAAAGVGTPAVRITPMVKLVEQCSGTGHLIRDNEVVRQVRYDISVFQGTLGDSGLPVPGLRTLTGSIDVGAATISGDPGDLVGTVLTLRLEDGRHLGIRLADAAGAVTEPAHGHGACLCC